MIKYLQYLVPLLGEVYKAKVYEKDGKVNIRKTMMKRTIVTAIVIFSLVLNIILVRRLISIGIDYNNDHQEAAVCKETKAKLEACNTSNQILTEVFNNTLGGFSHTLPKYYADAISASSASAPEAKKGEQLNEQKDTSDEGKHEKTEASPLH